MRALRERQTRAVRVYDDDRTIIIIAIMIVHFVRRRTSWLALQHTIGRLAREPNKSAEAALDVAGAATLVDYWQFDIARSARLFTLWLPMDPFEKVVKR